MVNKKLPCFAIGNIYPRFIFFANGYLFYLFSLLKITLFSSIPFKT